MYVTRPLSLYKKSPSALSDPPPDGPGSGILVVQDEEAQPKCCFGLARSDKIRELPIPQNKSLEIYYSQGFSRDRDLHFHSVWFIPVLGLPLSSNAYYAVHPLGKDRGEAFVCAKEEDLEAFCCYSYAPETEPQPFDPSDPFQQMVIGLHGRTISPWGSDFDLVSSTEDGFAPGFLGRKEGWKLYVNCEAQEFDLPDDAKGLDKALRERLPGLDFPLSGPPSSKPGPVKIGKWYVPFVFIKEGAPKTMRDERRASMFYSVAMEQRWERIFWAENEGENNGSIVAVDCSVRSEVAKIGEREAEMVRDVGDSGLVWFKSGDGSGVESRVGLSSVLVERIKWEEERGGFYGVGKVKEVRVERREECGGNKKWKRFGCYVLVERFVFKRMDGTLALSYEFRHTHQIRTKWE